MDRRRSGDGSPDGPENEREPAIERGPVSEWGPVSGREPAMEREPETEEDSLQTVSLSPDTRPGTRTPTDEGRAGPLDRIFEEHHAAVFRTAYRITGNAADAEDVLQTVFLRLLRREGGARLTGDPGPYLRLAAVNGALDVIRGRSGRRDIPLAEEAAPGGGREGGSAAAAGDRRSDPESRSADREMMRMLRGAIGRLGDSAARVFVLRHIEGYGNTEIARMLGMSRSVVAVTLHRARGRLRDELKVRLKGETR